MLIYLILGVGTLMFLLIILKSIVSVSIRKSAQHCHPTRVKGRSGTLAVFCMEQITIPSGQWREVSIGCSFSNVGEAGLDVIASTPYERVKRGCRVELGDTESIEWTVVVYNYNEYPKLFRRGDEVAHLTFIGKRGLILITNALKG